MLSGLRRTLHPSAYQGSAARPPYFEGWYFKLVDESRQHRLAIIPGVFKSRDASRAHAFIQVMDGCSGSSTYHTYPIDAFRAAEDELDVRIGPNRFRLDGVELDIDSGGRRLRGALAFIGPAPWPVTMLSPGIMGPYAWAPFMQTYHGLASFDHRLHGRVEIDGQAVLFDGGRGYIEKDWGRSFPSAWVWMQSNHFSQPGISISASIATIPWMSGSFAGFIIGLWQEGRLLRFASYTGARTERLEIGDERVLWVIAAEDYRLNLTAERREGGLLRAPTTASMDRRISETMRASIHVRLEQGGRVEFEDTGECSGLEVSGDLQRLVSLAHATIRRGG